MMTVQEIKSKILESYGDTPEAVEKAVEMTKALDALEEEHKKLADTNAELRKAYYDVCMKVGTKEPAEDVQEQKPATLEEIAAKIIAKRKEK